MGKKLAPDAAKARSQILKEKSIKMAFMADFAELNSLLKTHLEYSPRVLAFAQKLVLNKDPEGKDTVEPAVDEFAGGDGNVETPGSSSGTGLPAICDVNVAGCGDSPRPIDRRTCTMEDFPVKDLKLLVTSLERVSLSVFALRALVKRGAERPVRLPCARSSSFAWALMGGQSLTVVASTPCRSSWSTSWRFTCSEDVVLKTS
jgi:hypothetical protein